MKGKLKRVMKIIGKNFLSFVIGGVAGAALSVFYGLNAWLPHQTAKLSPGFGTLFGFLALIPVIVILFGILGIIAGGILGIIIYQIARRIKKRK